MRIDINIDKETLEKEGVGRNSIPYLFSEIARVSSAGYHRFVLKPDIIECFRDTNILNSFQFAQIERLCDDYYDAFNCEHRIPQLRVDYGNDKLSKCDDPWQIGHKRFLGGKYLEKTILLVESDDDIDFYEFLLNAEAKRIKFGYIAFEPYAGHGNSISKTLKRCIDQHKIVLCICDSDKTFPIDECGDTCKTLKNQKAKQESDFIGFLTCTPGREIENFLPIEIVHSVSKDGDKKHTNNLKSLIERQGKVESGDCLWLYYDVKKGIDVENIKKVVESGPEDQQLWVKEKYGENISKIGTKELPKYNDGVLGKFVKNKAEMENFKAHMNKEGGYWELHYSNWVQSLLWYVCGEDPRYNRED